jgi:adenosine deaminase
VRAGLAADGVVYAEVRMAPELCTARGLTLDEAVQAMLEGFARGSAQAASDGHPIAMKLLVTAMRQAARSVEVAACAVRWRDAGVVGFDIAGPEAGYRPTRHLDAFDHVRRENFHITIHAGESFGLPSIWEALQFCGARALRARRPHRRRHHRQGRWVGGAGPARRVRARPRVPLEMRPTSNVHTGAAASIAEHPFDLLRGCASGHRQHRQPADERRLGPSEFAALRRRSAWAGRDGVADDQRPQVGVRAVR